LSLFAFRGPAFERTRPTLILLMVLTLFAMESLQAQTTPQQVGTLTESASQQPTQPQTAALNNPQTPITIDAVTVFPQAISQFGSIASSTQNFVLEISGKGFASLTDADLKRVQIAVFPAGGVTPTPIPALSLSLDKSKILAQFTAPTSYVLQEVAVSTGSGLVTFNTGTLACDFEAKAKLMPQAVPKSQAGNKYGNGIAKNFYAIQISIVNECPMAIIVPLAGISVVPNNQGATTTYDPCTGKGVLVAFSLDHVTSIYSTDRKSTGRRAIYFNTVQALAAIGSAVQPFFAPGFTQGVAILGGGFTTASKDIFVDMSAEQLQNLTSQSFGSTEQIASHGSLQKFVFVRRNKSRSCRNSPNEIKLRSGDFYVIWQLSPASAAAPKTLTAQAQAK
jgi:hypothetical protein